jgi:diaminopimelate decarboxylase
MSQAHPAGHLLDLAAAGTPLFVYDRSAMREQARAVRAAFEGEAKVLYATKANGHPDVLATLRDVVDGADVTSAGALRAALDAGYPAQGVQYTSPGKSASDLRLALDTGVTVVLGGADEAAELARAAGEAGVAPGDVACMVRVNPHERIHAFRSATAGLASPFGVPEEELDEQMAAILGAGLRPRGLHVHRGSQCTSATAYCKHIDGTLALADRLAERWRIPRHVNMGGGLGVAPEGSEPLPLASLGKRAAGTLRWFRERHPEASFALEPGRYLVAEAGTLLLRVLRRREVRGTTFLVLDGGIDVFLFASERMRHGPPPPITNLTRPHAARETVTLVGPACTSEDTLVADLPLARSAPGDLLAISVAGAYAAGASVSGFLGRDRPREVVV